MVVFTAGISGKTHHFAHVVSTEQHQKTITDFLKQFSKVFSERLHWEFAPYHQSGVGIDKTTLYALREDGHVAVVAANLGTMDTFFAFDRAHAQNQDQTKNLLPEARVFVQVEKRLTQETIQKLAQMGIAYGVFIYDASGRLCFSNRELDKDMLLAAGIPEGAADYLIKHAPADHSRPDVIISANLTMYNGVPRIMLLDGTPTGTFYATFDDTFTLTQGKKEMKGKWSAAVFAHLTKLNAPANPADDYSIRPQQIVLHFKPKKEWLELFDRHWHAREFQRLASEQPPSSPDSPPPPNFSQKALIYDDAGEIFAPRLSPGQLYAFGFSQPTVVEIISQINTLPEMERSASRIYYDGTMLHILGASNHVLAIAYCEYQAPAYSLTKKAKEAWVRQASERIGAMARAASKCGPNTRVIYEFAPEVRPMEKIHDGEKQFYKATLDQVVAEVQTKFKPRIQLIFEREMAILPASTAAQTKGFHEATGGIVAEALEGLGAQPVAPDEPEQALQPAKMPELTPLRMLSGDEKLREADASLSALAGRIAAVYDPKTGTSSDIDQLIPLFDEFKRKAELFRQMTDDWNSERFLNSQESAPPEADVAAQAKISFKCGGYIFYITLEPLQSGNSISRIHIFDERSFPVIYGANPQEQQAINEALNAFLASPELRTFASRLNTLFLYDQYLDQDLVRQATQANPEFLPAQLHEHVRFSNLGPKSFLNVEPAGSQSVIGYVAVGISEINSAEFKVFYDLTLVAVEDLASGGLILANCHVGKPQRVFTNVTYNTAAEEGIAKWQPSVAKILAVQNALTDHNLADGSPASNFISQSPFKGTWQALDVDLALESLVNTSRMQAMDVPVSETKKFNLIAVEFHHVGRPGEAAAGLKGGIDGEGKELPDEWESGLPAGPTEGATLERTGLQAHDLSGDMKFWTFKIGSRYEVRIKYEAKAPIPPNIQKLVHNIVYDALRPLAEDHRTFRDLVKMSAGKDGRLRLRGLAPLLKPISSKVNAIFEKLERGEAIQVEIQPLQVADLKALRFPEKAQGPSLAGVFGKFMDRVKAEAGDNKRALYEALQSYAIILSADFSASGLNFPALRVEGTLGACKHVLADVTGRGAVPDADHYDNLIQKLYVELGPLFALHDLMRQRKDAQLILPGKNWLQVYTDFIDQLHRLDAETLRKMNVSQPAAKALADDLKFLRQEHTRSLSDLAAGETDQDPPGPRNLKPQG